MSAGRSATCALRRQCSPRSSARRRRDPLAEESQPSARANISSILWPTMKLTVRLKLLPSDQQRVALRGTLEAANAAANVISSVAWRERTFGRFKLQQRVYADTRTQFELSAQVVIRVIAKVAD